MTQNTREGFDNDGLAEADALAALDEQVGRPVREGHDNDGLTEDEANAALDEQA